ncbi:MAG: class I SAM-dependent methyltransferase [Sphingomonas bacterium]|nr:class I SAM-dependent methyltransferase [Sphingomonas bacterium]
MSEAPRADPAWDSFWRYDRLSSFHAAPGAANYAAPIADGWRGFFQSLPDAARIVDLCTGNGAIAVLAVESAAATGKQFDVTGADLAAIRPAAFVTNRRAALEQVRFLANTPAEMLPMPDATIDAIVSQYGIEYSDLARSIPEAVRILAPGGALRFAIHAAEGSVARDTVGAIADADFLLDLDLVGLAARSQAALDAFNAALKAIADRVPAATDRAMLANVHRTLCETFDHRRGDLVATATHLHGEVIAHRRRQSALLSAARSTNQMADLGSMLEALGLGAITHGEQRDGADLIGHVIEAVRS